MRLVLDSATVQRSRRNDACTARARGSLNVRALVRHRRRRSRRGNARLGHRFAALVLASLAGFEPRLHGVLAGLHRAVGRVTVSARRVLLDHAGPRSFRAGHERGFARSNELHGAAGRIRGRLATHRTGRGSAVGARDLRHLRRDVGSSLAAHARGLQCPSGPKPMQAPRGQRPRASMGLAQNSKASTAKTELTLMANAIASGAETSPLRPESAASFRSC
jgi:hypothetical protein